VQRLVDAAPVNLLGLVCARATFRQIRLPTETVLGVMAMQWLYVEPLHFFIAP